jgi:hypothetical protein
MGDVIWWVATLGSWPLVLVYVFTRAAWAAVWVAACAMVAVGAAWATGDLAYAFMPGVGAMLWSWIAWERYHQGDLGG